MWVNVWAMFVKVLVIDTESEYLSSGFTKEVAKVTGGHYYYLPHGASSHTKMTASASRLVSDFAKGIH